MFSKLMRVVDMFIIIALTGFTLWFTYLSIITQYTGGLPYLVTLTSVAWAAYGVDQAAYYSKSKAENTLKIRRSADLKRDC